MNKGNNSHRFRHWRILRGCRAEKGRDRVSYAPETEAFGAPGSRGSRKAIQGVIVMPIFIAVLFQLSGTQAPAPPGDGQHEPLASHVQALDRSLARRSISADRRVARDSGVLRCPRNFCAHRYCVSWLLQRGLSVARFNYRIARYRGSADGRPTEHSGRNAGRICFWGCILIAW